MKKRIISAVLVVVTLFLTLVSCGYNFTKKDMSENAQFVEGMDAQKFKDALLTLLVEDADFGADTKTEQRDEKVKDYYYQKLESLVTTSSAEKLTDGEIDANDIIVYSYFATFVKKEENKEDETIILYPGKMSSTEELKLGYSDFKLTGKNVDIKNAIVEALKTSAKFDDYKYDNKGNIVEYVGSKTNLVLYVSYGETKVEQKDGEYQKDDNGNWKETTTSYTYAKVTLDSNAEGYNKFLVDSILAKANEENETGKYSFGTKITDTFTNEGAITLKSIMGEDADTSKATDEQKKEAAKDDVKYTNVTVHFATEVDAEGNITTPAGVVKATYKLEDDITDTKEYVGQSGDSKITVKEGTEVTYYVYPTHYFDVEDLTAEYILKTTSLTSGLLEDSEYSELVKDVDTAAEGEEKSLLDKLVAAATALKTAEDNFKTADKDLNGDPKATSTTAKNGKKEEFNKEVQAAITAAKNGKNDAEKSEIDAIAKQLILGDDGKVKAEIANSETPYDALKKAFDDAKTAAGNNEDRKAKIDAFSAKILISAVEADATSLGSANKKYREADEALNGTVDKMQAAYDEVLETVMEEKKAAADSDAVKNDERVTTAKKNLDEAKKGAKVDYKEAFEAVKTKIGDLKDDSGNVTKKFDDRVMEAYLASVKEMLISQYEDAMTTNIGKAVWALINEKVKVTNAPKKAVDDIYDRMYEIMEYEFYNIENEKTEGVSNYVTGNRGGFKQFFIDSVFEKDSNGKTFEQAEEQLRKEAVAYVEEIVRVYYIAEVLDLELSKKEIRDKKKESGYKVNKKYYGEINIMAALQADKIFDYFLEVKKTEDGEIDKTEDGKKQYVNVKFTIKPDDDDADDADK